MTMLNTLMDVAEAKTGTMRFNITKVSVSEIIRSVIDLYEIIADDMQIIVHTHLQDNMEIYADRNRIQQITANLVDNAIKYSEPKSTILLKAQRNDSEIKISVEDQGIGIAQKHLPRLFERFYRVDKARSRNSGGTGLGLAIVKHIAQVHNGEVTVTSAPGQGSTFTITLPA
jgi:two-component system phosphate regulon sensor histidine kinase PhoR